MKKYIITFVLCLLLGPSFSQTKHKTSFYLLGQCSKTLYDKTIVNNQWGMGLGLQLFLNSGYKVIPVIDFSADAYFRKDKALVLNPDDSPVDNIGGMVTLFAGASYHPLSNIYFSLAGGPGFMNGQIFTGLKPAIGFYFSPNQKVTGKISYINIFNRNRKTKSDFGSAGISVGLKLF